MTRSVIIGDPHGCYLELSALLEDIIQIQPEDKVVFAGDLLHKGPDSADVVKYARSLPNTILVLGNHEEKHQRWMRWEAKIAISGGQNPLKHVEEYPAIRDKLNPLDEEFLADGYLYYRTCGRLVVHAGIPGNVHRLPHHDFLHDEDMKSLSSRDRKYYKQLWRVRYEDERGAMVSLGNERPEHKFWAENYDGRFGHVVFGHQPWLNTGGVPKLFPHATGIDLGCVFGGQLCALVIEEEHPHIVEVHTIDAYQSYAVPLITMQQRPE